MRSHARDRLAVLRAVLLLGLTLAPAPRWTTASAATATPAMRAARAADTPEARRPEARPTLPAPQATTRPPPGRLLLVPVIVLIALALSGGRSSDRPMRSALDAEPSGGKSLAGEQPCPTTTITVLAVEPSK